MTKSFSFALFCILLINPFIAKAQNQVEKDIRKLHYTIDGFIRRTDGYFKERKSEAMLMILEIDSAAAVKDIHLLVDTKNIDSSYVRLQKMKTSDFAAIKFISWKNKIINLPIYSLTSSVDYIEKSMIWTQSTLESRQSVLVRPLYYLTIGPPIEESPPNQIIKVSDTKKKN